jgi:hypothetical protein
MSLDTKAHLQAGTMVMHRSSALLLLCSVASIAVLAVSYVRGGPTSLVEYSVMPNSPMNYPTPYYPGATDEDQSPAIDPNFEKAVETSEILYKKLKRILKESDKKEQVIDSKVTKAMNFVSDQVTDINQQVQKINKEDSDKIADVPLIPGPPGIPGINGIDGRNGDDGPTGAQGSRGARGASGVQGPSGPAGVGGFAGDIGAEGPEGRTGGEGPDGLGGMEGQEGPEGSTGSWAHTKFDCMEAATEHMRLVHCNRQGCRLETYFAGRWGTVCDRGFDDNSVGILCKALGFSMGRGVRPEKFGFKKNLAGESSAISTGSEKIWLSSIMCLGGEGDIGDCKHSPWGVANQCSHENDVGICCFGINDGPLGVRKCKSDFDDCPDAAANWGDTGTRLTECDHKVYIERMYVCVCVFVCVCVCVCNVDIHYWGASHRNVATRCKTNFCFFNFLILSCFLV